MKMALTLILNYDSDLELEHTSFGPSIKSIDKYNLYFEMVQQTPSELGEIYHEGWHESYFALSNLVERIAELYRKDPDHYVRLENGELYTNRKTIRSGKYCLLLKGQSIKPRKVECGVKIGRDLTNEEFDLLTREVLLALGKEK